MYNVGDRVLMTVNPRRGAVGTIVELVGSDGYGGFYFRVKPDVVGLPVRMIHSSYLEPEQVKLPKTLPPTNESTDLSLTSYGQRYNYQRALQDLDSENADVRWEATQQLGEHGRLDEIVRMLDDEDEDVRRTAIYQLGEHGRLDEIVRMLDDEDEDVRRTARSYLPGRRRQGIKRQRRKIKRQKNELPKTLPPTNESLDLSLVKHAEEVPYAPVGANYVRIQWYRGDPSITLRLLRGGDDLLYEEMFTAHGGHGIHGTSEVLPDFVNRHLANLNDFWSEFALLMERARYYAERYRQPDETVAIADSGLYERVKEALNPVELPSELPPTQAMKIPEMPSLWYTNEADEKYILTRKEIENCSPPPEGFVYQHSSFPTELTESIFKITQKDEVRACPHPVEDVEETGGWVDGIEGRKCNLCGGTQIHDKGTPWPDEWDSNGSTDMMTFHSSWPESLVKAMVDSGDYELSQAILVAANTCERCMNALADKYGLDWGYPEYSEEWQKSNTVCDFCRDENDLSLGKSAQKYNVGEYGVEPLMVRVTRSLTIHSAEGVVGLDYTIDPGQYLYIRGHALDRHGFAIYTFALDLNGTLEFTASEELVDSNTEPVEPEVQLPSELPPTQASIRAVGALPRAFFISPEDHVYDARPDHHSWLRKTFHEDSLEFVCDLFQRGWIRGANAGEAIFLECASLQESEGHITNFLFEHVPHAERSHQHLIVEEGHVPGVRTNRAYDTTVGEYLSQGFPVEAAERRRYDRDLWMIIPGDLTLVEPKHSTIIVSPGDQVHGDVLKKLMLDGKIKHGLTADEYDRIARGFYTTEPPKIWWYAESGGDTSFLADHLFDLYTAAGLPNTTPIEKISSVDLSLTKHALQVRLKTEDLNFCPHDGSPLRRANSDPSSPGHHIWECPRCSFNSGRPVTVHESTDLSLTSYGREYFVEECRQLIATRENVEPDKLHYDGTFPASPSGRVPAAYQFTLLDPGHPRHGATWAHFTTDSEELPPTQANISSGEEDFMADTFQQGLPGDARHPDVDETEEELRTRQRGRYYQKPTDTRRNIFPWSTGGDDLEGTAGVDLGLVKEGVGGFRGFKIGDRVRLLQSVVREGLLPYVGLTGTITMRSQVEPGYVEVTVDQPPPISAVNVWVFVDMLELLDVKLPSVLPPTRESIKTPSLELAGVA